MASRPAVQGAPAASTMRRTCLVLRLGHSHPHRPHHGALLLVGGLVGGLLVVVVVMEEEEEEA